MKSFKEYMHERLDDREHQDLERRKEKLKKLTKRYKDSK